MSTTIENTEQNGTAGNDPKNVADMNWEELAAMPISELVPKTFDDHSRIHDPKNASALFETFTTATENWLENHRSGIKLSRNVAVAMLRLRRAVTDLNGDPIWAVKGTVAWKVIYENRIAPFYSSLKMSDSEITALKAAVKTYIADRQLLAAVMAERAIETTNLLGQTDWVIDTKTKESVKFADAVATLLGDDQSAASKYEGVKLPDLAVKGINEELKRQVVLTGKNKGKRKQGFEKRITQFGPVKATRSNPNPNDPNPVGNTGHETYKSASDTLCEFATSINGNAKAGIGFAHDQVSAWGSELVRVQKVKGGGIPALVDSLDNLAALCTMLADYKRPGNDRKPDKDAIRKLFSDRDDK